MISFPRSVYHRPSDSLPLPFLISAFLFTYQSTRWEPPSHAIDTSAVHAWPISATALSWCFNCRWFYDAGTWIIVFSNFLFEGSSAALIDQDSTTVKRYACLGARSPLTVTTEVSPAFMVITCQLLTLFGPVLQTGVRTTSPMSWLCFTTVRSDLPADFMLALCPSDTLENTTWPPELAW